MKVIRSLKDHRPAAGGTVATIGNFDGLHLGHQRVLTRLQQAADERRVPSTVVTFEPHPVKVLAPNRAAPLILPYGEKLHLLERLGIDETVVMRFTPAFASTDAETFVREVLHDKLNAVHVLVGPDTRFGHDRGGDFEQIQRLGAELGFTAEAVAPVEVDGRQVSSSAIRRLVLEGDLSTAALLLGRFHRLRGEVVRGFRRGRTLGYPTANLATTDELLPADGVYAGRLWRGYTSYDAVVNVGVKPTFGDRHRTVEAHLLEFSGVLYGEHVALDLLDRIRPERRFRTSEDLASQIAEDVERARRILEVAR